MDKGVKHDQGKLRWSLFPWDAGEAILRVLEFGAGKYAPRNWELGMDWSRLFDALVRHLKAWHGRESNDPDSKLPHLWHAGACILFLIAYELRGMGKDDRP